MTKRMSEKLITVKKSGPSSSPLYVPDGVHDGSVAKQLRCRDLNVPPRVPDKVKTPSSFKCPSCDFTAPTQQRIDKHRVVHSTERPWRCPEVNCHYRSKLESRLKRHIKVVHGSSSRPFKCPPCGYSSKTLRQLQGHFESIRHVQTKLNEGKSNQVVENDQEDGLPSASASGEMTVKKTLACSLCPKKFAFSIHLQTHLKRHKRGRPYKCTMCDFAGGERKTLEIHMRGKHTGEKPYKCRFPPCPFACASSSALKNHEDAIHLRLHLTKFRCLQPGCNFGSRKATGLKIHTLRHTGERPFACPKPNCPFKGVTRGALKNHMSSSHSASRPFKCPMCQFRSKTKGSLNTHLRRHTGEKPYKCDHDNCTFATSHGTTLVAHRLRIHERELYIKRFQCPHCPVKTESNSKLLFHIKTHTGEKPFACSFEGCRYRSLTQSNLRMHVTRFHLEERPFKCQLCDYRSKCKRGLASHIESHTQEKRFKCPLCEYSCIQPHSLQSHLRTHTGEKPFACNFCKYRGATAGSLYAHLKVHTGEKTFKCKICDYAVVSRSKLGVHMRVHTDESPYKCQEEGCNFAARQPSNLTSHFKRKHRGEVREKKFECRLCPVKMATSQSLEDHIRIHTGEKPFACHLCEYRTTQKSHLTTHTKSHERHKNFGIFKCPHCSYISRTGGLKNLNVHLKTHQVKPLVCPQCPSWGSDTKKGLGIHMQRVHGEVKRGQRRGRNAKKFVCKFCKLTTKNEIELVLHTNDRHRWPIILIQRLD